MERTSTNKLPATTGHSPTRSPFNNNNNNNNLNNNGSNNRENDENLLEAASRTQLQREELFFPQAPQPDIVRSAQKDQYYQKYLNDYVFDLVNQLLGKREFPPSSFYI